MTDVLEVSMHIEAKPETVFPYFTDPARYAQWMGQSAILEPMPGGTYRIRMRGGVEAVGRFVEIDPPHRMVFTWGWTDEQFGPPSGSTRVVVTLEEEEDGGTRVVLRHHDLPTEQYVEQHRQGWELYLARLATRATGGDPGPDPNA